MSKADWLSLASQVLLALAPILAGAGIAALIKLAQVFHLQVTTNQLAVYEALVAKAVAYVHEVSAKKEKDGTPLTGPAKLALAAQFIVQRLGDRPEHIESDIEAELGRQGIGAADGAVPGAQTEAIGFAMPAGSDSGGAEERSRRKL